MVSRLDSLSHLQFRRLVVRAVALAAVAAALLLLLLRQVAHLLLVREEPVVARLPRLSSKI